MQVLNKAESEKLYSSPEYQVVLAESFIHTHWESLREDSINDLRGVIVDAVDYVHVVRAGLATLMNGKALVVIADPIEPKPLPDMNETFFALVNSREKFKIEQIENTNGKRYHKQKGRNRHVW